MIYSDFHGKKLSLLGFGTMRLPLVPGGTVTDIDQAEVERMVAYAIGHGVNYFDTAYPYHGSMSEVAIGKALSAYPRESFYLADKFPGHQISSSYDPAGVFEDQLKKCGVDYFDFYLMHNVNEHSIRTYKNGKWHIVDYFVEQKRLGRINHLGFSCHGGVENIKEFLDAYGEHMEFCQIQLNYLDWTLQNAKGKYELLTERGIPVWVMEPVRGGKLAKLPASDAEKLTALHPEESVPSWGFHWLQGLPNVKMVLSGMSELAQMEDNVSTFNERRPLSEKENALLMDIAERLKDAVPCTGCRYCCAGCPKQLDIPMLISLYNDVKMEPSLNLSMRVDAIAEDKLPQSCIGCGKCRAICPQGIDVPKLMKEMPSVFATLPSWAELCRQREEAQNRAKGLAQKNYKVAP